MDDFKNDIHQNKCGQQGPCFICTVVQAEERRERRANKPDAFSSTNEERVRKAEYF
jgi:hypothetical protein